MIKRNLFIGVAVAMAAGAAGCTNPLARSLEEQLHEELMASQRAYREAIAAGPVIELQRPEGQVESLLRKQNLLEQADSRGGPRSYSAATLDAGRDLMGDTKTKTVAMTLQRAIELSVRNNLDVRIAQIIPAISDTQVTQAEAVFDAVLFSNFTFQYLDTPQPPTVGGLAAFGSVQQKTIGLETGIRKVLPGGGQITVSSGFNRNERNPSFFAVNNYYDSDVLVSLTQPLLRNFGSDVTRSNIALSQNARDEAVQDMRSRMLETVAATEQAYWQLVFARQQLLIQSRLFSKTFDLREVLRKRFEGGDARIDAYTDALSREELRRADLIRARAAVRQASDALKQLIYAKNLPLSSETLISPLETPPDLPMSFSLLDSVTTALNHRPELRRALLEIKDASIRERVADNQRLPQLDVALTARLNGVGLSSVGSAYDALEDRDFVDYIAGFQFEVPIGNRGPEAALEQRRLERRATVINYRRIAQQVVKDVKDTMRALDTSYEVIGATRSARRAAAERLRVLEAQEDLTPDFVDLTLRAQDTLAAAEIQEIQAMSDYNTAIARYYQAMGTLLERNGIEVDETPNDDDGGRDRAKGREEKDAVIVELAPTVP